LNKKKKKKKKNRHGVLRDERKNQLDFHWFSFFFFFPWIANFIRLYDIYENRFVFLFKFKTWVDLCKYAIM
jgi:hypothetical protein